MPDFLQSLLPSLEHFQYLGYWLAFFAALLETIFLVGLLIPGSTVILLLGTLAASGQLDFAGLFWFAAAGAILGDNLNYWLGKHYGQRWIQRGFGPLNHAHLERVHGFFAVHGAKSVFLGRFIPTIKELVPFVAGSAGMRKIVFMFWNILGGLGWSLAWLGAGYLFARSLGLAQLWLSRLGLLMFVILLLVLLLAWLKQLVIRYGREWWRLLASVSHSIAQAVSGNPDVQQLVRRHPGFFGMLHRRFALHSFYGLPLTLLGLAFLYLLALFGGIVEDLLSTDPIVALDKSLAQLLAAARTPQTIRFSLWISNLGAWQVVTPFLLIILAGLWRMGRAMFGVPMLVAVVGSEAFTFLGKYAFHRPRPVEAVLLEHSYAFPSGHATIAVAFYGYLAYLLIRSCDRWRWRVNLLFGFAGLILLIGLSRLVLGVHYLSDVLGGYLVGGMWLVVAISLAEWRIASHAARPTLSGRVQRKALLWLMAGMMLAWYAGFNYFAQPAFAPAPVQQAITVRDPLAWLKQHAPPYTETALGEQQQPLSLLLVAEDDAALRAAFDRAGFQVAQQPGLQSLLRFLREGLHDARAPLAPAFWNGRLNDAGFEKRLTDKTAAGILAVQLWQTPLVTSQGKVYVGTVRRFSRLRWKIWRRIDPDLDAARDRLRGILEQAGVVQDSRLEPFVPAQVGKTLTGEDFFTRGEILRLQLSSGAKGSKGLKEDQKGHSPISRPRSIAR